MRRAVLFIVLGLLVSVAPAALAEDSSSLNDRLQAIVVEKNITLDDAKRALVIERCEQAQAILRQQAVRTEAAARKRQASIQDAQKEMLALKLRLARQNTDASELELLRGKLQEDSDRFAVASSSYGQAAADALTAGCKERPELFMAALISVRGHRLEQLAAAKEMTALLRTVQGVTVPEIKERLVL